MRALIAGGTGFIGRHLTRFLRDRNFDVVVVSRNPSKGIDYQSVHRYIDGDTVIINLAGENIASGRWTRWKKERILRSRVETGRLLVEEIRKSPVKPSLFMQASAVGYYGISDEDEFTEDSPPGDDFLSRVVVEWENSTAGVEEMGIRRVLLRLGVVLGRDGGAYPRLSLPFRIGLGGPVGSGMQWMSWIHIRDVLRAVEFLIFHESASGPFNITSPEPVRNMDFSRALCDILKKPCLFRVPSFVLRLLSGEMAEYLILSGQKVIPRRLMDMGFSFLFPHIKTALEELEGAR